MAKAAKGVIHFGDGRKPTMSVKGLDIVIQERSRRKKWDLKKLTQVLGLIFPGKVRTHCLRMPFDVVLLRQTGIRV